MTFLITLPFGHSASDLQAAIRRELGAERETRILKRSVDARNHRNIRIHYSISTDVRDPARAILDGVRAQDLRLDATSAKDRRIVIVGSGPAGLFCALWLQMHGIQPLILEQGPPMRERLRDMAAFMKEGTLRPYSNICFGAGGAGTYSDGKLITRIRSPYIPFVMDTFVRHGAPAEIRWLYNPHLGSNLIRRCIVRLIDALVAGGAHMRFHTRLTGFETAANGEILRLETTGGSIERPDAVFLACGHSSRETYTSLRAHGTSMSLKEFAVGLRVEHRADAINTMQYGAGYRGRYPGIETAQYRLVKTWKSDGSSVYSFCMCPGGYVLNASSDAHGVVTNGMSNHLKSGRFSNAAVVTAVSAQDLAALGYDGVDAALELQKELERRFRDAVNQPGSCNVVAGQRLHDFLSGARTGALGPASCLNPTAPAPLHDMFPELLYQRLRKGFLAFESSMRGFSRDDDAQLFGVESRTSAPYRIERDPESGHSPTHSSLYPIGEGAGYAGGITSAAVDGIRAAQLFLRRFIDPVDFLGLATHPEDSGAQDAGVDAAGDVIRNMYICERTDQFHQTGTDHEPE